MTNEEFSNEFDVLYNSIASNQAPGLSEYEKSVFLTKAQDELIKDYFNPKLNKTQEGFDGNERRQIDFSMIMRSISYEDITLKLIDAVEPAPSYNTLQDIKNSCKKFNNNYLVPSNANYSRYLKSSMSNINTCTPFLESFFDGRDNTKSVALDSDILTFVNEFVEVTRDKNHKRLTVLPINYTEYSRLTSKPYKRPLKNQAWRLLDNDGGCNKAEIVIGPNDVLTKYAVRYIKRPRPILLDKLDEMTLDGYYGATADGVPTKDKALAVQGIECELDPITHHEILQRAVELAKAAYTGDLQSQIVLGQASQTNIGAVQTSR